MENGCPFMMSWNEGVNTGFMTAKDNDVIAHEKRFPSAVDGVICAFHGGAGYLNNWLFLVRTTACKHLCCVSHSDSHGAVITHVDRVDHVMVIMALCFRTTGSKAISTRSSR